MLAAHVDCTLFIGGRTQEITLDVHTDGGAVSSVLWNEMEVLPMLDDEVVERLQKECDE